MSTSTLPSTHVGPTAEELAKRARIRELRAEIAVLARYRTAMNRAFRLPYRSPEWIAALTALGHADGAAVGSVNRHWKRGTITNLHIELADLRGKQHLAG